MTLLFLICALVMFATVLALVIYGYRTARALGSTVPLLWAIAMFMPCVNILVLLMLSRKATQACREHGIPVGFFGPKLPPEETGADVSN